MKTYKIHIHSPVRFIVVVMVVFLTMVFGISYLPEGINQVMIYILFVGAIAMALLFASKISMGTIRVEIDESGFGHRWTKRFIFSSAIDIHLTWNIMIDYFFEKDRSFDRFQITLENSRRYRFYRQNMWPMKDDYEKFQKDFPSQISKFEAYSEHAIIRGKTIYEEKGFKWVLIFMSLAVLLLIANAVFEKGNTANSAAIGMLAAGVGFYWLQVRMKRRKC